LSEDQLHAQQIAEILRMQDFVKSVMPVETNIIIFEVNPSYTAAEITEKLKEKGVLVYAISVNRVRMVLHLDITASMVAHTCSILTGLK